MSDCCNTFAYALLPNHYHFLIRVKENTEDYLFSKKFKLLIQDYTFRINKRESRSGNLFLKLYRRLEITSDEYFRRLVFYIHFNPEKHKISQNFKNYMYSSYLALSTNQPSNIERDEVLEWFGDKTEFINFHNYLYSEDAIEKIILE